MKKLILTACLSVFIFAPLATFATGQGGACKTDDDCDGTLACMSGTCQPGEVQSGGSCTTNDQCSGGATCVSGKCQGGSTNSGGNTAGGSTQVGDNQPFVPLTDIPAFANFNPSSGLPTTLNSIYYICIGIAVVIAVLQLARAGITYMLADSITSKEEARHLIGASILGLVLVLSPYLVFSIINPKILSLNINVSNLAVNVNGANSNSPAGNNGQGQAGLNQGQENNGAKPIFDGTYVDFVEFDGDNNAAFNNATSYTCQNSQQTKSQPFGGATPPPYYVSCVTPKVTYMLVVGGGALTQQDQQTKDTYSGECSRISNEYTGRHFNAWYLHPLGVGPNDPKVPCGDGQQCWQAYSTCTQTK